MIRAIRQNIQQIGQKNKKPLPSESLTDIDPFMLKQLKEELAQAEEDIQKKMDDQTRYMQAPFMSIRFGYYVPIAAARKMSLEPSDVNSMSNFDFNKDHEFF